MPGYLEGYGAGEEKREKTIKWVVLSAVGALLLGTILYFTFRDFREERQIKLFLELLQKQDYKAAYALWGCTDATPCRDYKFDKFMEDWGPQGVSGKSPNLSDGESCGTNGYLGVISGSGQPVGLFVDRRDHLISFAPWSVCPEPRLRVIKWLKMKLGKAS